MRFAFIDAQKACFPVRLLCKVLEVTPSGYCAWRDRPESHRVRGDRALTKKISEIHTSRRGTYGSPRIKAELVGGQGMRIGRKRVARLMR